MSIKSGYFKKHLHVDLTKGIAECRDLSVPFIEKYIGGRGFGAKLVWDNLNRHDFKIDALFKELDTADRNLLYSTVKKAYDIVRSYHRAYVIYSQTRGDYYRYATLDRKRDVRILDNAVNNLHRLYDDLKSQIEEES